MKKRPVTAVCLLLIAALCCTLCACGGTKPDEKQTGIKIVCIGFPEYDWTRSLLGENPADVSLSLIIDSGADPHSYQATVEDIAEITACDLLIHTGGVSDQWVADALSTVKKNAPAEINMLSLLSDRILAEELVEGMQTKEEHEHEEEGPEPDEHVWLSLRNAQTVCAAITEALCALDADNSTLYRQNLADYTAQLAALDAEFTEALRTAPCDTILVADRFPFRYLTEDYGIRYYAAFAGCSAETDASFETVIFLAEKLSELELPAVLTLDGSDARIAQAVLSNSEAEDCAVLSLNSMQSVRRTQIDGGLRYPDVMRSNLAVLRQALGIDAIGEAAE